MSLLRQLSVIYVAAACAWVVTIGLSRHPDWAAAARSVAHYTAEKGTDAAVALNAHVLKPGWVLLRKESRRGYDVVVEALNSPLDKNTTPVRKARKPASSPARIARAIPPVDGRPKRAAPPPQRKIVARKVEARTRTAAHTPQTSVTLDLTQPPKRAATKPASPGSRSLGPAELASVEQRLKDNLTRELYAHFDLFLYVSKAEKGPLAQRMYVFAKDGAGGLTLRNDWPVSTGREKVEYNEAGWKLPSYTPKGYYELDPRRMYRHYRSVQWGTPMPYAMFFNWVHDGNRTGIAIHAAHGEEVSLLGQRASAGCIRLAPRDARALFDLVRTRYKGEVPRFAYDRKTATMANDGMLMRNAEGAIRFMKGYKVLVVIENYGGENVVATLM